MTNMVQLGQQDFISVAPPIGGSSQSGGEVTQVAMADFIKLGHCDAMISDKGRLKYQTRLVGNKTTQELHWSY